MYIQNPSIHLQEQIKRAFGDSNIIEEIHQKYEMVTEKIIRSINIELDKRVIGQKAVKEQILKAIFQIKLMKKFIYLFKKTKEDVKL